VSPVYVRREILGKRSAVDLLDSVNDLPMHSQKGFEHALLNASWIINEMLGGDRGRMNLPCVVWPTIRRADSAFALTCAEAIAPTHAAMHAAVPIT
jgi:hypothetical protein